MDWRTLVSKIIGRFDFIKGLKQGNEGRWQMADGRWQMADGRWQMAVVMNFIHHQA
ncbi:MAG: hypothetical protein ACHBN1_01965 [Heteroscytonema crispum UTEX LB 1556]